MNAYRYYHGNKLQGRKMVSMLLTFALSAIIVFAGLALGLWLMNHRKK